ncbi:MAG: phage tail protein I [Rhodobacterales bacterium]|nr:MAG: phage tail protein I [Rhodobacterales bacterium]
MTVEELVRNLLPNNATDLERAAAETIFKRLDELPLLIDALWTPAGCPVDLLPYLAWALSVDVWDDRWPEQVKRDVIAAAPQVHRKKGTLCAVETALMAIGVRSKVSEWWETVPADRRGTFEVTAYANHQILPGNVVLSEEVQLQILRVIQSAKPKSRAFTFQVGAEFGSVLIAASAVAGANIQRGDVNTDRNRTFQTDLCVGGAFAFAKFHRDQVSADRNSAAQSNLRAGSGFALTQLSRLTFEATI